MGFERVLVIIITLGFFGGMSSYMTFSIYEASGSFKHKLDMQLVHWFCILVLNGVVGICGAFAIQILVLGMRFYENSHEQASDYIFLIAICVIAGFGARSFLFRLTAVFEKKIGELDEKTAKALTATTELQIEVSADSARREIINDLT